MSQSFKVGDRVEINGNMFFDHQVRYGTVVRIGICPGIVFIDVDEGMVHESWHVSYLRAL